MAAATGMGNVGPLGLKCASGTPWLNSRNENLRSQASLIGYLGIASVFGLLDAGLIPGSEGEQSTRPNLHLPMASRTRRSRHPCERTLPEDFRGSMRDPVRLLHRRGVVWAC